MLISKYSVISQIAGLCSHSKQMQGPGGSYKIPPRPWEMRWVKDGQELHPPVKRQVEG
jgi:hypothetical protein